MLNLLFVNPLAFIILIVSLVVAVTIHEYAHAWTAVHLGDPTPKIQGRLNLNPLSHLDPLGSLMLVLVGFGWGKPVQFDPFNLQNRRRDIALVSLAGPVSNLMLAVVLSIIVNLIHTPFTFVLVEVIRINILLAVFNLIPIHPLDGGKILVGLMPRDQAEEIDLFMRRYGIIILILLVFPIFGGSSPVFSFLSPIINFILRILLPNLQYI